MLQDRFNIIYADRPPFLHNSTGDAAFNRNRFSNQVNGLSVVVAANCSSCLLSSQSKTDAASEFVIVRCHIHDIAEQVYLRASVELSWLPVSISVRERVDFLLWGVGACWGMGVYFRVVGRLLSKFSTLTVFRQVTVGSAFVFITLLLFSIYF